MIRSGVTENKRSASGAVVCVDKKLKNKIESYSWVTNWIIIGHVKL